ncbi:hypothetical protein ASD12_24610 [Mesorhizobium sp. Root102]|uniref:hypothetical protein n=1 Tax=Mesorhizobium sp. Root102 TaxID=1736422 RepID=UPI0006FBD3DB|nr:hypothetical protein [Mesorhizobium sp. Root102]KQU94911.1 hypothetical protein ASD12_24610 [Mesorhizobium sp. Root102]
MFFTYPIAATNDNWLSSTLLDILQIALMALQNGQEPLDFQGSVPELYESEIARGRKFPGLYVAFVDACRPLEANQRDLILSALAGQNQFPELFAVDAPFHSIAEAFPAVHQATRSLFEYAFEKLSDLRTPGTDETVRARYHYLVHAHFEGGCCPFCGLEIMEAPDPDLVDPDLDHYLAASKYPFAGANLRNLTAMGTTCNRSYKGAQDILMDELNQKVHCFDPYGNEHVALSLDGTVLLPGAGAGPAWALTFDPDVESRNWRRIFKLESRIRANVLEKQYQTWLKHFITYAHRNEIDIAVKEGAIEAIAKFKATCDMESLPTVARLKSSFFALVENALNDPAGGDRMHNFLVEVA